jgi:hypothetical protein
MADVAKMVEEHLQHQHHGNGASEEPNFAKWLNIADKYEAHGLGVLIEELMTQAEMIENQRAAEATPERVRLEV